MASAQVLPNSSVSSRKLGHLEAGKKKLEEFRKRKAEGRAKKAIYTDQSQSADGGNNDKSSLNQEHERGEATSSRNTGLSASHTSPMQEEAYSSNVEHAISSNENLAVEHGLVIKNHFPSGMAQHFENTHMSKLYEKPAYTSLVNGYHDHWIDKSELTDIDQPKFGTANVATTDQITTFDLDKAKFDFENSLSSSTFSPALQSDDRIYSSTVRMSYLDASTSDGLENSGSMFAERRFGLPTTSLGSSSSYEGSAIGLAVYNLGSNSNGSLVDSQIGRKTISESISQHLSLGSEVWHRSEPSLIDSAPPIGRSREVRPSPSTSYGMTSGRSRPSFLDTLGVSRGSSTYLASLYETQKPNPHVSLSDTMVQSADVHSPSHLPVAYMNTLQQTSSSSTTDMVNEKLNSFVSSSDMQMLEGSREYLQKGHEVLAPKKDEDFSALEQYIEDLTQEKFSLQRALDASRTLAESLATENSSLTESYNQQAKFVGELKSEIERWQAEVVDQLRAVESLKMEYANAQLECNAADERAKILASEVIGLEEKALKLRSNELKLEKQVENLASEIASYKRKVSILEKEHQDFQSTINAMQEEKKLLQSKIRKVSSHSKVDDPIKVFSSRRDISTSTDDLADDIDRQTSDAEAMASNPMSVLQNNTPSNDFVTTSTLLPDDRTLYLSDVSVGIPHDQLRMIDNIGSLLSELALEKEELIQALTIQTSNSSKLKDLNKELSRKLEGQTQRLELLTAQRMANENILSKPTDAHSTPDTMQYADEGDEVVERVLGWIMKFFPGGSSKRRTSKLL